MANGHVCIAKGKWGRVKGGGVKEGVYLSGIAIKLVIYCMVMPSKCLAYELGTI